MQKQLFQFDYEIFNSAEELNEADRNLLTAAQKATALAHAPYSAFKVGAAARLANGEIITGGNQENASFPAGLCAEGVVLAMAGARFPGIAINTLAISYSSANHKGNHPISPCGICRQSMQEFKLRTGTDIRLIMGSETGQIIIVNDAANLMPFAFKL